MQLPPPWTPPSGRPAAYCHEGLWAESKHCQPCSHGGGPSTPVRPSDDCSPTPSHDLGRPCTTASQLSPSRVPDPDLGAVTGVLWMQATAFGFTCYAVIENRDSSLPPLLHHLRSLPRAPAASAHLGPHPAPTRSLRAFPPHQLLAASPRPALQTSSSGQSSKLVCYLVSRRAEPQLLQGGLDLPPELLRLLQPDSAMWFPYALVTPPLSVTVTCRGAVWTPETAVSTGPYV